MRDASALLKQAEQDRNDKLVVLRQLQTSMLDFLATEGSVPDDVQEKIDDAESELWAAQGRVEALLGRLVAGN